MTTTTEPTQAERDLSERLARVREDEVNRTDGVRGLICHAGTKMFHASASTYDPMTRADLLTAAAYALLAIERMDAGAGR